MIKFKPPAPVRRETPEEARIRQFAFKDDIWARVAWLVPGEPKYVKDPCALPRHSVKPPTP